MPLADPKVAGEIESVCTPIKCVYLNDWLNRLYAFRQEYLIYREELDQ